MLNNLGTSEKTSYIDYYHLEEYLFSNVHNSYHEQGFLNATDFFCIIIWKANRAKSKIADRLLNNHNDLESASIFITKKIFELSSSNEKLEYLMNHCGFRLPMATAILTVLYPQEFTVYDVRVCDTLHYQNTDFHKLASRKYSISLWEDYLNFKNQVVDSTPKQLSLRDKDRYLWGKSFSLQLQDNIKRGFKSERN
ncbi:hypothetical protein [Bacillus cereus]|nr:hypothetical protein [Bacillus cereus]BCB35597.1 hypothetical protein BCM0045_0492 [Bacillus cereus]BCB98406.1 hypothetical protein BCM0057_0489 [Bacillus cereus]BCC21899.1 hypothetical protein BCM0079_0492 [Bacillus cereus]BCC33510.1 hypothetical protein BCM0105_0500 [Bacillus cereus]